MLVYDITNQRSFDHVQSWIRNIQEHTTEEVKLMLVGNKCEKEERRQVSKEHGKQLADRHGMLFCEVSAKTGVNVEEAFHALAREIKIQIEESKRQRELQHGLKDNPEKTTASESVLKRLFRPIFGNQDKTSKVPEEIQQDPYATELYERALLEGKEHDRSIRINIVGNYKQGKTSLMKRLLNQSVVGVESTNGIDVQKYDCFRDRSGKLICEKAEATDSNKILQRLVRIALEADHETSDTSKSQVVKQHLFSGDRKDSTISESRSATRPDPFKPSSDLHSGDQNVTVPEVHVEKPETNVKEKIICSRSDTKPKVPMLSDSQRKLFKLAVNSKNSKSDEKKRDQTSFAFWDFGGQFIYYATHTLFHSKRALYILVFDLSVPLNRTVIDEDFPSEQEPKTMAYYIQFWMNSIHAFVGTEDGSEPVVLLVGTHKDKIKGDQDTKDKVIGKYFQDIRDLFDETNVLNHIYPRDFAVSNTLSKDSSISELRETIIQIGNNMADTIDVPAKWIQLEKSLSEIKSLGVTTFDMVQAVDSRNEFPLKDSEQIKLFLRFHHAKGTFIYFDQTPISKYVVLEPQFLIDAFKCVISSERFCTNDPAIRPLWKKLLSEARLEQVLIDRQWSKDPKGMFMKNKPVLLEFLIKHHIISEAALYNEQTKSSTSLGWYIVPSLLRKVNKRDVESFLQDRQQTVLRFVLQIHSSTVVSLVFQRLIAALIGKWSLVEYESCVMLFSNAVIIRLGTDHVGTASVEDNTIEFIVASLCPSLPVNCATVDSFRRFSECVVRQEFVKHRKHDGLSERPYQVKFRCNNPVHKGNNRLKFFEESQSGIVPCPDLYSHEIKLESAVSEWYVDTSLANIEFDIMATDRVLSTLAQCIGNNWELLGLELGVTQVEIEQIKTDNRTSQMQIFYMLLKWRNKARVSSLKTIVEAIKKTRTLTVD